MLNLHTIMIMVTVNIDVCTQNYVLNLYANSSCPQTLSLMCTCKKVIVGCRQSEGKGLANQMGSNWNVSVGVNNAISSHVAKWRYANHD